MSSYLLDQFPELATPELKNLIDQRQALKQDPRYTKYAEAVTHAPEGRASDFDFSSSSVRIGNSADMMPENKEKLLESLRAFIPWKKGPFNFFGTEIDAEWRSDQKWERFLPHTPNLEGKVVADIGCHNGYFMFRMLEQNPKAVVGIEPFAKHAFAFELAQKYIQSKKLHFELLGVEHMDLMPNFYDVVFCLGILYHHTDPVGILRKIRTSMKKGAALLIDCQGIPGEDSIALVPKSRYARAKGIWFLPTASCLENWLIRSQFHSIEFFYSEQLSTEEQRTSEWAPIDSLEQFLDPNDPTKTIEGYPAPTRIYCKAKR